jgi:hypothetical protein
MASSWNQIISDALIELGVYSLTDSIPAADTQFAIRRLNRILDEWSARRAFAYTLAFPTYQLTANHSPHLIGPALTSPDFAVTVRPTRIRSAQLILTTSTPNVFLPLNIRDDAWWAAQSVPKLTSTVPTDLFYSPDYPNGSLYLWPNPSFAYKLQLETEVECASVPLNGLGNPDPTQLFVGPQGYENAVMLTLAEYSADGYGRPMPASLPGRALRARMAVVSNNIQSPRISSADIGTASSGSGGIKGGGFNWITGMPV